MKSLIFPIETYKELEVISQGTEDGKLVPRVKKEFVAQNELKVGVYELMDVMLAKLVKVQLDRKEHKVSKKLNRKLREIGRFKDDDNDALIIKEASDGILTQTLNLEDAEYELLKKLLESAVPGVVARYSATLTDLMDDVIDKATDV